MTIRNRLGALDRKLNPSDAPAHVVAIVRDRDGREWRARRVPPWFDLGLDRVRFVPASEPIHTPPGHRLILRQLDAGVPLVDLRVVYRDVPPYVVAMRRVDPTARRFSDRWQQDPPGVPILWLPTYDDRYDQAPDDPEADEF